MCYFCFACHLMYYCYSCVRFCMLLNSFVCVYFFFFFFFKQKTAYEMRISDWSSDVCSSDLHRDGEWQHTEDEGEAGHQDGPEARAGGVHRSEERRVGKECVSSVDLGGRRIIKKKNRKKKRLNTTHTK